jgi:uncharacterized OsmC-like protein
MSHDHGAPPEPSDPLWVERVGPKTYVARNARGAQVRIGPHGDDGVFSPGELLKVALAACSTMSAERPVLRRLGTPDAPISGAVRSIKSPGHNRYETLLTELVLPVDGIDADRRAEIEEVARHAVAKSCTVGRTLEAGAAVRLTVTGEG